MMKKIQVVVLMSALISPTIAAVCQWQCPFMSTMSDVDEKAPHELVASAAYNIECCTMQAVAVKKPLPELRTKFAPSASEAATQTQDQIFYQQSIIHESPPGALIQPTFTSSATILRI